jgi:hypothetical protein
MVCRFVDRDMVMRYHWGLGVGHVYGHHPRSSTEAGTSALGDEGESQNNASEDASRSNRRHDQGTALWMDQARNCRQPHQSTNLGTSASGRDGGESLKDVNNNPNGHDQFNQCADRQTPGPINDVDDTLCATGGGKQDEFEELREPEIYQRSGRRKLSAGEESDGAGSDSEYDDSMTRSVSLQNLDAARDSAMDNDAGDRDWQPEEAVENELDDMYGDTQDQESTSYD